MCKVALCWNKSGEGGCSAPCSRPFIKEGIREEGNLLPKRGMVVKTVLTCFPATIRWRHFSVCTGSGQLQTDAWLWLLLVITSARGTFPLAPPKHKKLFACFSFLRSVGSLFKTKKNPNVLDMWWGGLLMDDYIWELEADGRETEQGRSILYCSAQRLPCFLSGSVASFLVAIYHGNPGGCNWNKLTQERW